MVIVDGHHRFRICEKHGLPFKMLVFSFSDLLEAKQWALDTQKGRRNLDKWELGKIALKLRDEVEAKARKNMSLGGQAFRPSKSAEEGSATLPNLPSIDTRKELAQVVGLGERTMGKVMQIDEHAPTAIREALDRGELSINQGYNLTRQIQGMSEEQKEAAAAYAVEMIMAGQEIRRTDAEAEHRGKIAGLFCKAYEKAVLLTPTLENVRLWVEGTRMRPDEIEDSVRESYELSHTFQTIGDLLKNEILPKDWQINVNLDEQSA